MPLPDVPDNRADRIAAALRLYAREMILESRRRTWSGPRYKNYRKLLRTEARLANIQADELAG